MDCIMGFSAVTTMKSVVLLVVTLAVNTASATKEPMFEEDYGNRKTFDESPIPSVVYTAHDVKYYLYTRENPTTPLQLLFGSESLLDSSYYDHDKILVIICHGFWTTGFGQFSMLLKEAFLEDDDVNVVIVDWSPQSLSDYVTAKNAIPSVGREVGTFINWLATLGTSYKKVHCVGFSLGAHAMGIAGKTTGAEIARITGLDPAGPFWELDTHGIDRTDAGYVEIIHTNINGYGTTHRCGDADFYVNGGDIQPGCPDTTCSHMRSYEYFAETVKGLGQPMVGRACKTISEATLLWEKCSGEEYVMGTNSLMKSGQGIFRVNTENLREVD